MKSLALALALVGVVLLIRMTAPSDLYSGDQPKQVAYIRDIARNGAWLVQHEVTGEVASKPPLYNWLAAPLVVLTGRENEFLMKLPSILAAIATVVLVWDLARRIAGDRVAHYALLFLVLSQFFSKNLYYARTDMLLTVFVVMQFWAAVRHEEAPQGNAWIWIFRIGGALGMLTKGPIALLIPLAGLAGWWWSRGVLRQRIREMRLVSSLIISVVPTVLWFAAASTVEGRDVYQQLIRAETIDRFVGDSTKSKEHRHPFYYLPHFFARLAPWSFLAAAGVLLRGRRDVNVWWLLAPFVLLSLVPSKRADRLLPLLPAVCVLAATAYERFDHWRFGDREPASRSVRFVFGVILVSVVALTAAGAVTALRVDGAVPRGVPATLTLALGSLLAALAALALVALLASKRRLFEPAFLSALVLGIAVYQHVLSGWAKVHYEGQSPPSLTSSRR